MRILYLAYTVVVNGCNLIGSALPQPLAQILHLRTRWFNPSQLVLVAYFLHPLASALCDGGVIQYVSDQTTRTHTYFIWHMCVLVVTGCTSCGGGIIMIYVLYGAYLLIFVFLICCVCVGVYTGWQTLLQNVHIPSINQSAKVCRIHRNRIGKQPEKVPHFRLPRNQKCSQRQTSV